jgi:hypothetical protein
MLGSGCKPFKKQHEWLKSEPFLQLVAIPDLVICDFAAWNKHGLTHWMLNAPLPEIIKASVYRMSSNR